MIDTYAMENSECIYLKLIFMSVRTLRPLHPSSENPRNTPAAQAPDLLYLNLEGMQTCVENMLIEQSDLD